MTHHNSCLKALMEGKHFDSILETFESSADPINVLHHALMTSYTIFHRFSDDVIAINSSI